MALGGMHVETEYQAIKIRTAMRSEGFDDSEMPEPGQFLTLPMCISPCPRVSLERSNEVAASIAMAMVSAAPWTEAVTQMYWNAYTEGMTSSEKQRLVTKIATVMTSEPVLEFLRKRQQRNG